MALSVRMPLLCGPAGIAIVLVIRRILDGCPTQMHASGTATNAALSAAMNSNVVSMSALLLLENFQAHNFM